MSNRALRIVGAVAAMGVLVSCKTDKTNGIEVVVVRTYGEARYTNLGGKSWKPVEKELNLHPGDLIQTAPKSLVDLRLNKALGKYSVSTNEDETAHIIRVFENSALRWNKLTKSGAGSKLSEDIELDLAAGEIMGLIGTLHPASRYEIKISRGAVNIHRGIYMVSSDGMVNVFKGAVSIDITNKSGSIFKEELVGGESFDPETGIVTSISGPIHVPIGPLQPLGPQPKPSPFQPGLPHGSEPGGSLRKF